MNGDVIPLNVYDDSNPNSFTSGSIKTVAFQPKYRPIKSKCDDQSLSYPCERELMVDFMYVKIPALEIRDQFKIKLILAWDSSIYDDRVILSWKNSILRNGAPIGIIVEKGSGKWHRCIGEISCKYCGVIPTLKFASNFARAVGLK